VSVAFTREESAETAAEVELPHRPISPHPNLGLEALTNAMSESRIAYEAAQRIEDAAERRRAVAVATRDMRYFADRLRTAQLVPPPADFGAVAFGHRVTFRRDDGRHHTFRIVGEDEADPRNGSISYISPVARALIGRAAGEVVLTGDPRSKFSPSPRAGTLDRCSAQGHIVTECLWRLSTLFTVH
jgi:transcription elongation GreA/GreB family factor